MEEALEGVVKKRLRFKREHSEMFLAGFSLQMSGCFAICDKKEIPALYSVMEKNMELLLKECDISRFPEIGRNKAMDALNELSNYACIFVPMAEKNEWYSRVVLLIEDIKSTYPLGC